MKVRKLRSMVLGCAVVSTAGCSFDEHIATTSEVDDITAVTPSGLRGMRA